MSTRVRVRLDTLGRRPGRAKPVVDSPRVATYRSDMVRRFLGVVAGASVLGALFAGGAFGDESPFGPSTFTPRVPISSFAQPKFGIDMSRLNMSTSFSVGTGWGGTSSALNVTRFSYQFRAPMWMSVSLGNVMGGPSANGSAFFLEGLDFAWRPNPNMVFQVSYQDIRSPLQYRDTGFGFIQDPYRVR